MDAPRKHYTPPNYAQHQPHGLGNTEAGRGWESKAVSVVSKTYTWAQQPVTTWNNSWWWKKGSKKLRDERVWPLFGLFVLVKVVWAGCGLVKMFFFVGSNCVWSRFCKTNWSLGNANNTNGVPSIFWTTMPTQPPLSHTTHFVARELDVEGAGRPGLQRDAVVHWRHIAALCCSFLGMVGFLQHSHTCGILLSGLWFCLQLILWGK